MLPLTSVARGAGRGERSLAHRSSTGNRFINLRASPEDSGKLVHYSDYFFFDFPVKILVIVLMSAVVKTTSPFLT